MNEWKPIETAPRVGDFLAYIANGYITRARFMSGSYFGADNLGPRLGGENDTRPLYWMPLPEPPR